MRTRTDYSDYLQTRARLLDWMIEVFEAFADKGTDEYTYFRAVHILDSLIDKQKVKEDNLHIYGVAAINIASKMLDYKPITIDDCYKMVVHEEYTRKEILKRVNKALNLLHFDLNQPTWVEYLDKLIFDVFGDHREELSVFNVRQAALFALHLMYVEVKFLSIQPKIIAAIAVNYAVNSYFEAWEKNTIDKIAGAFQQINTIKNKDKIIESICRVVRIPLPFMNENMRVFYGYLGNLVENLEENHMEHLFNLFNSDKE